MGFEGYREVNAAMHHTMGLLRSGLERTGKFVLVSAADGALPLVAFHLKDDPERTFDEFHVADRLRM